MYLCLRSFLEGKQCLQSRVGRQKVLYFNKSRGFGTYVRSQLLIIGNITKYRQYLILLSTLRIKVKNPSDLGLIFQSVNSGWQINTVQLSEVKKIRSVFLCELHVLLFIAFNVCCSYDPLTFL